MRIGSGARALPGAGARQRGPRQGRQNRGPSERGRQEGQLRAALRVSKAGNAASPAADEDKAPDSRPLRPQPRGPLRSVTRTVRAGSGFHWWPGSHQAPPTAPGSPAPFRARVSGARAPSWPCRGARRVGPRQVVTPAAAAGFSFLPWRAAGRQVWDRDNVLRVRRGTPPGSTGLARPVPLLETRGSRL